MTKVLVDDNNLCCIADAIRLKNGETEQYKPCDMARKIEELETSDITEYFKTNGFVTPAQNKQIWTQALLKLPSLDIGYLTDLRYAFYGYKGSEIPLISDTSRVTYMSYMFSNCSNIKSIPQINTSSAKHMERMFQACTNLESVELDTSAVTNSMAYMFDGCNKITKITLTDTSKATSMEGMFGGCNKLQELSDIDASSITANKLRNLFYNCYALPKAVVKNTGNITNAENLFYNCQKLTEVEIGDTSNVTDMSYMFFQCYALENIPILNTGNVTDFSYMFYKCTSLANAPELDTSNAIDIQYMFCLTDNLVTIPLYNCPKVTKMYLFLTGGANNGGSYNKLTTLGGFKDLGKGFTQKTVDYAWHRLNLDKAPNLTHDSLMNVINNLYDLNISYGVYDEEGNPGTGTLYPQKLALGSTNLAKLTEEEIAIATNKGWTVSVS